LFRPKEAGEKETLRGEKISQKVASGKTHEAKSSNYCVYISQSVIAGEEVTVIQRCMDHNSSISREVCSV
jgi:hypothetical protein